MTATARERLTAAYMPHESDEDVAQFERRVDAAVAEGVAKAAAAQGPLAAIRVALELRGTGPTDGALLGRIAGILALTDEGGAR